MLLVAVAAAAFAAKAHFIDRPATQRRAAYYREMAESEATHVRSTEALFGPDLSAATLEEIRQRKLLAKQYLDASRLPDKPNEVVDEENKFLRWKMEAMNERLREQKRIMKNW